MKAALFLLSSLLAIFLLAAGSYVDFSTGAEANNAVFKSEIDSILIRTVVSAFLLLTIGLANYFILNRRDR